MRKVFFAMLALFACGGEPDPPERRCGYEAQEGERCNNTSTVTRWTEGICVKDPTWVDPSTQVSGWSDHGANWTPDTVCIPKCQGPKALTNCGHVLEPDEVNGWWNQGCIYTVKVNGQCLCGNHCIWQWIMDI